MNPDLLKTRKRLITHANCPDGLASAMIIKNALPDIEVVFVQYDTEQHRTMEAKPGDLFCDFTPHRDRVADWAWHSVCLDHHKGAADIVAAFDERGVFADEAIQPGVSGAVLAYREVWIPVYPDPWSVPDMPDRVQAFALLAGIRDTWRKDAPLWKEACAQAVALMFYGSDHFLGETQTRAYLLPTEREVGQMLFAKRIADAKKLAGRVYMLGNVAVMNRNDMASDTAEQLRLMDSPAVALASFSYTTDLDTGVLRLVWSLRSIADGFDVGALARAAGGGGHTRAAGFVIAERTQDSPILLRSPIEVLREALAACRLR